MSKFKEFKEKEDIFFPVDDVKEPKKIEGEKLEIKPLILPIAEDNKNKNSTNFFLNYDRYSVLTAAFEKANANIIIPEKTAESIEWLHELRAKHELIVFKFLDTFIRTNELIPYDPSVVNEVLEPFIPKCFYNKEKDEFEMEIDFVPFLKFKSIKDFALVKNTLVYLIMEGIERMEVKPKYNENAVLIIFSIYSPLVFDLDNIEIKYIIDAMRYSQFFTDDSCKYVSYMVQGEEEKKHPYMKVKIIKKSSVKIED